MNSRVERGEFALQLLSAGVCELGDDVPGEEVVVNGYWVVEKRDALLYANFRAGW